MPKLALVVDDSKIMCEMIAVKLKAMSFEVTSAFDGVQGVDKASKEKFDVIITDINMPNMDGIELIRLLRDNGANKFTPVLVLTTEGSDEAKKRGKAAGASGWIVKPFKPEVLEAAVTKVCGL